jgi:predicted amidohydrolase
MTIRVATTQYRTGNDVEANLQTLLGLIDEAADGGAQLVVAPEFGNHTSFYSDAAQAWEVAVEMQGPYVQAVRDKAAQRQLHVVFNATCRGEEAGCIYISNFLVGPDGRLLGRNDKQALMGGESLYLTGAKTEGQVFETAIGRIGMMSCLDGVPPECARNLALRGAQIITNGHNSCALDEPYTHIPVSAAENHVWVIASGKVGPVCTDEMLQPLADQVGIPPHLITALGENPVLNPQGEAVARFECEQSGVLYADIEVELADDKSWADGDLFADRRPDLYGPVVAPPSEFPLEVAAPFRGAVVNVRSDRPFQVNVQRATDLVADAAHNGAQLVVLPELFPFQPSALSTSLDEALERSARVEKTLAVLCADKGVSVACSLLAEDGGVRHVGILIGADGACWGRYYQTHLSNSYREWATPGDELPVWETPLGHIGMLVGYDAVFPEAATVLARRGAEIIVHPTTWRFPWEPSMVICERASENRVSVLSAARRDSPISRGSMINALSESVPLRASDLNPIWPMEAPHDRELYISTDIHPQRSRNKDLIGFDLQWGRRPELYGSLVEQRAN